MANKRVLDPTELQKILARNRLDTPKEVAKPWFDDPARRAAILEAYENEHTVVRLGRRLFGLKRRHRVLITGREDTVYVYPLDDKLVPCGELLIRRLKEGISDAVSS